MYHRCSFTICRERRWHPGFSNEYELAHHMLLHQCQMFVIKPATTPAATTASIGSSNRDVRQNISTALPLLNVEFTSATVLDATNEHPGVTFPFVQPSSSLASNQSSNSRAPPLSHITEWSSFANDEGNDILYKYQSCKYVPTDENDMLAHIEEHLQDDMLPSMKQ